VAADERVQQARVGEIAIALPEAVGEQGRHGAMVGRPKGAGRSAAASTRSFSTKSLRSSASFRA
jgi:hypothetical protein